MSLATQVVSGSPNISPIGGAAPVATAAAKLNAKTILQAIGQRICQVSTIRGRCSGVFLGDRTVLVPFHAIGLKKEEDLPDGKSKFSIFPIEISYNETTYTAIWLPSQKLDNAYYYDISLFQITDEDFTPFENVRWWADLPSPGDKVYFAGFPLTQKSLSFHKAMVSSVEQTEEASYFMIDGTVLPGNSGGGVFICKDGEISLIGMIFAELANIDRDFVREKQLVKHRLADFQFQISDVKLNQVLIKMLDTVFNNLATGIGKVISIKHVRDLAGHEKTFTTPSPFLIDFPVVKEEQLPGKLGTDPDYLNWYHRRVKGKTLCGTILGVILASDDQITKEQEKDLLRPYYEKNVLASASKGYQAHQQTTLEKYLTLKEKIDVAKPKAIQNNKERWKTLLTTYMQDLPDLQMEIDLLMGQLQ